MVDAAGPASLVRSVCLADQAALPAKKFADTTYKTLPASARVAVNRAAPRFVPDRMMREMMQPLAPAEVPNRILTQLPRKDLFLILPAPAAAGAAAQMCAVVWKGALSDAREFLEQTALLPLGDASRNLPGQLQILRTNALGAEVSAAEYDGWAIVSLAPESALKGEKG
jgi:hypothetical protein